MKRFGKLFLGLLCMILLFACSHASDVASLSQKEIVWVPTNKITVEWDATTTFMMNSSPITKQDGKVMYLLYVKEQNSVEEVLVEKYVNEVKFDADTPIPETICEIRFEDENRFKDGHQYLLGVQAGIYKFSKDEEIIGEPSLSTISWSCDNNCTSNNPFGVKFIKK